jgi:hypothetical protein
MSYRRILVTSGVRRRSILRSKDLDSVIELYTEDDFRHLVVSAKTMPTLLGGLCELGESGLVREAAAPMTFLSESMTGYQIVSDQSAGRSDSLTRSR